MTATVALDRLAILGALHRRDVRFVLIGGIAGYLLGSNLPSANLDICFALDLENARRLADALNDMHATLRGSMDDQVDEHILHLGEVQVFNTDFGVLRCVGTPTGTDGYDDLQTHAECMEIDDVKTYVACLPDLIRMKEGSDRPRDRMVIEMLRAVQRLRKKR